METLSVKYILINNDIHEDIKETPYHFDGDRIDCFGPVEKINFFVGANNSGKSRFLRGLAKSNQYIFIGNKKSNFLKYYNLLEQAISYIHPKIDKVYPYTMHFNLNRNQVNETINDIHENIIKRRPENLIGVELSTSFLNNILEEIKDAWEKEKFKKYNDTVSVHIDYFEMFNLFLDTNWNNIGSLGQKYSIEVNISNRTRTIKNEIESILEILKKIDFKITDKKIESKTYIPILRHSSSLYQSNINSEPVQRIDKDIFLNSVVRNYKFFDKEYKGKIIDNVRIETGLDLYKKIRVIRNSRKEQRADFQKFEEFLSVNFFNGKTIDIVALENQGDEEKHLVVYIGKDEQEIHNLGDGIQQIIMLMYPIFTAPKGSWIFIEEPEINLHPGLQRIFLNQILKNETIVKKDLTFFITTHSNHLLDISLEKEGVSIFTFDKKIDVNSEEDYFEIKNVKSNDTDILDKLGVNTSSVFLANCSIWVEGVTDRYYIRAFLKAYLDCHKKETQFKEDINYAFFEYAGSNVEHYLFAETDPDSEDVFKDIEAQFLSNKIFLIADKDNGKSLKHERLKSQENKNFKYYPLDVLEVENILSKVQLEKYLPDLHPFFKQNSSSLPKIKIETYYDTKICKYFKMLLKQEIPKNLKVASGSLSTYYKNKLAKQLAKDCKWEDMSEDAKTLTKSIYEFIKESNK